MQFSNFGSIFTKKPARSHLASDSPEPSGIDSFVNAESKQFKYLKVVKNILCFNEFQLKKSDIRDQRFNYN